MRAGLITRARRSRVGREGQAGAAMIEFTLIALLLFILLFGIAEFGIMINKYLTLTQVARSAARSYAVGVAPSDVKDTAVSAAYELGIRNPDLALDDVVLEPGDGTEQTGQEVRVRIEYSYTAIVTGIFRLITGSDTIDLQTGASMRREAPYTDVPEP